MSEEISTPDEGVKEAAPQESNVVSITKEVPAASTSDGAAQPAAPVTATLEQEEAILKSFTFCEMDAEQKERQQKIFKGAQDLARVILRTTKMGALQQQAMNMLYQSVTIANQSVQFEK